MGGLAKTPFEELIFVHSGKKVDFGLRKVNRVCESKVQSPRKPTACMLGKDFIKVHAPATPSPGRHISGARLIQESTNGSPLQQAARVATTPFFPGPAIIQPCIKITYLTAQGKVSSHFVLALSCLESQGFSLILIVCH